MVDYIIHTRGKTKVTRIPAKMCSTKVVEKALRAGEKTIGETSFRPMLQEFADVLAEELHQIELIPSIFLPMYLPKDSGPSN